MHNAKIKWVVGLLALVIVLSLSSAGWTATPVSPMRRWFESAQWYAQHGRYQKALRMYSKLLGDWPRKPELRAAR
jgi:hypothetical protein